MGSATLHYIHDPLCGWCYGAAPLLAASREVITTVAHGGGMMAGSNRQQVSERLRNYVMPHDRRIAQLTGQHFGEAYFDGLLRDDSAVFDSEPPITAILAADRLGDRGLDLLARMQLAHFQEGRRIAEVEVLNELAADLGLPHNEFADAFQAVSGAQTQAHMAASRALLARVGGAGFPTFAWEHDGHFAILDIGPHLGHPESWTALLNQMA